MYKIQNEIWNIFCWIIPINPMNVLNDWFSIIQNTVTSHGYDNKPLLDTVDPNNNKVKM